MNLKLYIVVFVIMFFGMMELFASQKDVSFGEIVVDDRLRITEPSSFIIRTSGTKKHFEDLNYFMAIGTSKQPSLKVIYYNITKEKSKSSFKLSLPPEYGILAKSVNYKKCYIYKQNILVTYKGKKGIWYTGRVESYPYVASFTEISSERREKFIEELCKDKNGNALPRLTTMDAAISDDLAKKKKSVFDHFDFKKIIDSECEDSSNLKANKNKDKAGDFVPPPQ